MVSYDEHLNDVNSQMQHFQSSIAIKVWEIEGTTPEDGNCCFWAVSSQLDRLGIASLTHSQLRQKVVAFIQDLPEVPFKLFILKQNKVVFDKCDTFLN